MMPRFRIDARKVRVRAGRKVILNDCSLSIAPGEFAGLLGPSGSGKSTLIKVLAGLIRCGSGEVTWDGLPFSAVEGEVRGKTGYVPQEDVLPPALRAARVLHFAALLRLPKRTTARERKRIIRDITDRLELTPHAGVRVEQLSGGQRKRLSLAMELITEPSVLFLDEPTSGLDPGLEKKFMELFRSLCREGRTIIVTTHVMEHVDLLDIIFLIYRGHLVYAGPPGGALSYFSVNEHTDIYRRLEDLEPTKWKERFEQTLFYQQYVEGRLARP